VTSLVPDIIQLVSKGKSTLTKKKSFEGYKIQKHNSASKSPFTLILDLELLWRIFQGHITAYLSHSFIKHSLLASARDTVKSFGPTQPAILTTSI